MGATNFTSHYDLPQFVANDKPSWLGDVNSAFLKIDTAIADASATAQSANSAATSAQTQVAGLTTQLGTVEGKANTALNTANSAEGKATTAQEVASAASVTAGEAKTAAQGALPLDGGTMTGSLVLNGAPTQELEAATKGYVDSKGVSVQKFTNKDYVGGTFTAVVIGNCLIVGGDYTVSSITTAIIATLTGNPLNVTSTVQFGSRIRVQAGGQITYLPLRLQYNDTANETRILYSGAAVSDTNNICNGVYVAG